jgi:hypothetical protein
MNVDTESALRSLDAAAAPLTEPERHRAMITHRHPRRPADSPLVAGRSGTHGSGPPRPAREPASA